MPIEIGVYYPGAWGRRLDAPVARKEQELERTIQEYTGGVPRNIEWKIIHVIRVDPDETYPAQCMCSCDNGLLKLYVVKNLRTEEMACIGSECIKKFNNPDLNSQLNAWAEGRLCRAKNPIDRRTAFGKRGMCQNENCPCHMPRCAVCNEYRDECICPRCIRCRNPPHLCRCEKCFNEKTGEFKHFKDECTCPRCPKCNKLKKECRCEHCGNLCFGCVCKACKNTCQDCICEIWCQVCTKKGLECVCRRCPGCWERIDESEPKWKKLCLDCYRNR